MVCDQVGKKLPLNTCQAKLRQEARLEIGVRDWCAHVTPGLGNGLLRGHRVQSEDPHSPALRPKLHAHWGLPGLLQSL